MTDIISLGINIAISDIDKATKALDKLADASVGVEKATSGINKATKQTAKTQEDAANKAALQAQREARAQRAVEQALLAKEKTATQAAKTSAANAAAELKAQNSLQANIRAQTRLQEGVTRASAESAKRIDVLASKQSAQVALANKYATQAQTAQERVGAYTLNQQSLIENRALATQARITTGAQRQALMQEKFEFQKAQAAERATRRQEGSFDALKNSAARAAAVVAALFAIQSGVELVRSTFAVADSMILLEGRLKLATKSQAEFTNAQNALRKSSVENGFSLTQQIDTYTQLERSTRAMGLSVNQLTYLTESFGKAAVVSGADAASYQSALAQLNQGLASGVVRGQEFNSVSEQAPAIMEALANGLRGTNKTFDGLEKKGLKGVAALRKMAGEGELTSSVVIPALIVGLEQTNKQFEQMPITIGRATESLKSSLAIAVSDVDKLSNSSGALVGVLDGVAEAITSVTGTLTPLSAASNDLQRKNAIKLWSDETVNSLSYVADFVDYTTRTIIVLQRNANYMVKAIGTEIGGISAQVVAVMRGDFAGAKAIGEAMRADAAKTRKELDELDKRTISGSSVGVKIRQQQEALKLTGAGVLDAKDRNIQQTITTELLTVKGKQPTTTKAGKAPKALGSGESELTAIKGRVAAYEDEIKMALKLGTAKDNLNEHEIKAYQIQEKIDELNKGAKNYAELKSNLELTLAQEKRAGVLKKELDAIQARNKAVIDWRKEVEKLTEKQENLAKYTAIGLDAKAETSQEIAARKTKENYEAALQRLKAIDAILNAPAGVSTKEKRQAIDAALGVPAAKQEASFEEQLATVDAAIQFSTQQGDLDHVAKLEADKTAILEAQAAKRNAIREEENNALKNNLSTLQSTTGSVLELLKNAGAEQSGIYKALFAANKAFAIANSIVSIQKAYADAFAVGVTIPEKIANFGIIASQTASIVSTIASTDMKFAKGSAFDGPVGAGSDIVSTPTTFPMSGGRTGMLGERAGEPEGILPLTRDANGRLGVTALGGGGGSSSVQQNNITINVSGGNTNEETAGVISRELLKTMERIADSRISNATRPTGILSR